MGGTVGCNLWVRPLVLWRGGEMADNQLSELIQAVSPGTNFSKRCNHSNFLRGCRCCCIRPETAVRGPALGESNHNSQQWPAQ